MTWYNDSTTMESEEPNMEKQKKAGDTPFKTCNLTIRMEPERKQELKERLAAQGLELSDYVRRLIALDEKEGYVCKH